MVEVKFIDIGDGLVDGKFLEYFVKVGDTVKDGDLIANVETDKVNAEIFATANGTIAKLGLEEGQMIDVGQTVAVIDDGTGGSVEPAKEEAPAASAPAQTSGPQATHEIKFVDVGDGLEEGKLLELKFKVGDKVKEGDSLASVETDKVTVDLPSPVDATVVALNKNEGDDLVLGDVVVLLDDGSGKHLAGQASEEAAPAEKGASVIGEIEVSDGLIESSTEASAPAKKAGKKALATPVARNLAKKLNVDINEVPGTGPNGRVMKEDIEKFAAKPAAGSAATQAQRPAANVSRQGQVRVEEITSMRRSISNAMTQSKTIIPETVLMDEVVIDELVEMRKRAKPLAEKQGVNLTYMAFIAKATLIALKEFEIFNSSFDHDTNEIIYKEFVNLGFAVDTPAGLIVPNIKDADTKSVFDLAGEIRELADKAIDRKVQMDDIQNGTFTITNFGSVGISYGTPVINYPEVGILGVGKISQKPIVVDGEIKIGYVLPLSIAVDHRIIDGADAGRFLFRVKELLANPELMLLS